MGSLEDLTTDQLLARARQLEATEGLVRAITADPDARRQLQGLIRKVKPGTRFPELEAEEAASRVVKSSEDRVSALEAKLLEEQTRTRLERQRSDAKSKYNLSDDDMAKVEALMTHEDPSQRIPGYETAARVFKAERQQSIPTSSFVSPPAVPLPEQDTWGAGIGNKVELNKIALREAYSALSDYRGQQLQ